MRLLRCDISEVLYRWELHQLSSYIYMDRLFTNYWIQARWIWNHFKWPAWMKWIISYPIRFRSMTILWRFMNGWHVFHSTSVNSCRELCPTNSWFGLSSTTFRFYWLKYSPSMHASAQVRNPLVSESSEYEIQSSEFENSAQPWKMAENDVASDFHWFQSENQYRCLYYTLFRTISCYRFPNLT